SQDQPAASRHRARSERLSLDRNPVSSPRLGRRRARPRRERPLARVRRIGDPALGSRARREEPRVSRGGGVRRRDRLAGGSADAGAVLRALDALSPRPLGPQLVEVASSIGADVPFLSIESAMALAWGRGERLFPVHPLESRPIVLLI